MTDQVRMKELTKDVIDGIVLKQNIDAVFRYINNIKKIDEMQVEVMPVKPNSEKVIYMREFIIKRREELCMA